MSAMPALLASRPGCWDACSCPRADALRTRIRRMTPCPSEPCSVGVGHEPADAARVGGGHADRLEGHGDEVSKPRDPLCAEPNKMRRRFLPVRLVLGGLENKRGRRLRRYLRFIGKAVQQFRDRVFRRASSRASRGAPLGG